MLRPEYENNLSILIITIPEFEIEIQHKTPSWVWDLLVITTQGYMGLYAILYKHPDTWKHPKT